MATADDVIAELRQINQNTRETVDAVDASASVMENAKAYLGQQIGEVVNALTHLHQGMTFMLRTVNQSVERQQQAGRGGGAGGSPVFPGGARRGRGGGMLGGLGRTLGIATRALGIFGAALGVAVGAVAIYRSALDSSVSGLKPFKSALNLIGTMLGGILMPAFVALAGFVYALAMLIAGQLLPAIHDFYTVGLDVATHELVVFGEMLAFTTEALKGMRTAVRALGSGIAIVLRAIEQMVGLKPGTLRNTVAQAAGIASGVATNEIIARQGEERRERDEAAGRAPGIGVRFMRTAIDGMAMAVREMRMSIGPKGGFTGIAQAQREAIEAGIGMSPFEQKLLEIQERLLREMEKAVAELQQREAQPIR